MIDKATAAIDINDGSILLLTQISSFTPMTNRKNQDSVLILPQAIKGHFSRKARTNSCLSRCASRNAAPRSR